MRVLQPLRFGTGQVETDDAVLRNGRQLEERGVWQSRVLFYGPGSTGFVSWSSLRAHIPRDPAADEALLIALARYPDEWVQREVLRHPNATAEVARTVLIEPDDSEVREAAEAALVRLGG